MLGAEPARLTALRTEAPSQAALGASRPLWQPISGLVSLQHLAGTAADERTRAQTAGRKTTPSVRDARLYLCDFDKKAEDFDTR